MSQPEYLAADEPLIINTHGSFKPAIQGTANEFGSSKNMTDFLTGKLQNFKYYNTILGYLTPPLPFHITGPEDTENGPQYYLKAGPISEEFKEISFGAYGVNSDNMVSFPLGPSPELPPEYKGHEFVQYRFGVNILTPKIVAGVLEWKDDVVSRVAISNGTEFTVLNADGSITPIEHLEEKTEFELLNDDVVRYIRKGQPINFSKALSVFQFRTYDRKTGIESAPDLSDLTTEEIETSFRLMLTKNWNEDSPSQMKKLQRITNIEPTADLINEGCERWLDDGEYKLNQAWKIYVAFPALVRPEFVRKIYLASPVHLLDKYHKESGATIPQELVNDIYLENLLKENRGAGRTSHEIFRAIGNDFDPNVAAESLDKLVQSGNLPRMSKILELHSLGVPISSDVAQHFVGLDNIQKLQEFITLTGTTVLFPSSELEAKFSECQGLARKNPNDEQIQVELDRLKKLMVEGKIIATDNAS